MWIAACAQERKARKLARVQREDVRSLGVECVFISQCKYVSRHCSCYTDNQYLISHLHVRAVQVLGRRAVDARRENRRNHHLRPAPPPLHRAVFSLRLDLRLRLPVEVRLLGLTAMPEEDGRLGLKACLR
jgi:hypothetical protein